MAAAVINPDAPFDQKNYDILGAGMDKPGGGTVGFEAAERAMAQAAREPNHPKTLEFIQKYAERMLKILLGQRYIGLAVLSQNSTNSVLISTASFLAAHLAEGRDDHIRLFGQLLDKTCNYFKASVKDQWGTTLCGSPEVRLRVVHHLAKQGAFGYLAERLTAYAGAGAEGWQRAAHLDVDATFFRWTLRAVHDLMVSGLYGEQLNEPLGRIVVILKDQVSQPFSPLRIFRSS